MFLSHTVPLSFKTHWHKKNTDRHLVCICMHTHSYSHTPALGCPAVAFRCLGMPGYAFSLQRPLKGCYFSLVNRYLWPFPHLARATLFMTLFIPRLAHYVKWYDYSGIAFNEGGMFNEGETQAWLWESPRRTVLITRPFKSHKTRKGHWWTWGSWQPITVFFCFSLSQRATMCCWCYIWIATRQYKFCFW